MLKLHFQYSIICLLGLLLPHKLKCQSYTFNPGKTYVTTVDTSANNFGGIEIQNTGTQNLNLTWRWVSTDTLIDSKFELCNSGICFMNLPASGIMPSIAPGGIGWIKFHMFSSITTGTNTIKYTIRNGSSQLDTLTFKIIVAPAITGIKENSDIKKIVLYPSPSVNETFVDFNLINSSEVTLKVFNNIGQIVYQTIPNLNAGSNIVTIDTKNFCSGIYDVVIESKNGTTTKKLSVSK
jgi:hypothetical protein